MENGFSLVSLIEVADRDRSVDYLVRGLAGGVIGCTYSRKLL